ncbi:MAG: ATP-binding protein [Symploca sp. SIO3E6]|nr:ATP-binding protein [Caldora sp. SIO3E6]
MNQENSSHQQQFQSFGDISAQDNAQIVIQQTSKVYQFIAREEVKERKLNPASPYIGLKKFESDDQNLFFGREQWIAKSIEAVRASNLILLLGASGSGKSSLIRAGLIPRLKNLLGKRLISLVLTPDRNPFESFRSIMIAKEYGQEATAAISEQQEADILAQTCISLQREEEQWLIFIDQFEQLFTRCKDTKLQKSFIDGITRLASKESASIKIVLAMRADFLDKLSPYPSLTGHQLFLNDMQPDELRLAIEQPAAQHGVIFEDGLVEQIINDVQGQARLQPGSLPLLQYTLDLLWENSQKRGDIDSRTLRKETYLVGGTVRDALQKKVDDIYGKFSLEEQAATKQIFLKLVNVDNSAQESEATSRVISRRAYGSEFGSELEKKTLDELVSNNLLVTSRQEEQPTVELAHEILINSWSKLKGWIEESLEAIILRNRLADDAQRWQVLRAEKNVKAEDELWSGSKLGRVLEFKQEQQFESQFGGLSSEQEEFVSASVEKRDRIQKKEARDKLILKIGASAVLLAVSVATGAGFFAKHNRDTNKSLQLANASATNLTIDPTRSVWLGIAAHLIRVC